LAWLDRTEVNVSVVHGRLGLVIAGFGPLADPVPFAVGAVLFG
jgi:hypothetical protein